MKKFLFIFLILFNLNFAYSYNDSLLDCEFLYSSSMAQSLFDWLTEDYETIRSLMPDTEFIQFHNVEKMNFCKSLVNDSSLTNTEKKVINAQIFNLDSRDFSFGIIDEYHNNLDILNKNFIFGNEVNSTFIKNAGYRFITLNPSVKLGNEVYISTETQAVRSYHYEIEVPEDFEAESYPLSFKGYCAIEYGDVESNVKEIIFFDEEQVTEDPYEKSFEEPGKHEDKIFSELITSKTEGNVTINANFEIDANYLATYSEWHKVCDSYKEGKCVSYDYECDEIDTKVFTDKVIFTDNYYSTIYKPKKQEEYEIWSEDGMIYVEVFIDDTEQYQRVVLDRFLDMNNYYSVIRYKFEPLDFLYFEAVNQTKLEYEFRGKNISEFVSSVKYNYKSPLVQIKNESIVIAFKENIDKLYVEFETFFGESLSYEINLTKKKQFKNIILNDNNFFYWKNDTIEVRPYLVTENGLYFDNFDISYVVDGNVIDAIKTTTNDSVSFEFEKEGYLILEYPGDENYYPTIYKKKLVREPAIWHFILDKLGFY